MPLDEQVRTLATGPNFAALTTLFEDGSPQTQVMWIDADDDHLLINTEAHRAKFRNVQRDPRVAVAIWDRDDPYRYVEVRGRVTATIGGAEARAHIDRCAERYTGAGYAPRIQSERVVLQVTPDRIVTHL